MNNQSDSVEVDGIDPDACVLTTTVQMASALSTCTAGRIKTRQQSGDDAMRQRKLQRLGEKRKPLACTMGRPKRPMPYARAQEKVLAPTFDRAERLRLDSGSIFSSCSAFHSGVSFKPVGLVASLVRLVDEPLVPDMESTTTLRKKLVQAVNELPTEALVELDSFVDYLVCKVNSADEAPARARSGSSFLLAIAGLGAAEEDDLSERDEEVLASEIDPIRGWGLVRSTAPAWRVRAAPLP